MTPRPRWTYITSRRLDLGESIQDFAERAGIGRPTLSLIESGHRVGRPMTLKAIADRLDMTVTELLATRPGAEPGLPNRSEKAAA